MENKTLRNLLDNDLSNEFRLLLEDIANRLNEQLAEW